MLVRTRRIATGSRGVLVWLLFSSAAVVPAEAKDINGGDIYKSRTMLFSMTVPKGDGYYAKKFRLFETSKNNRENRVEEAAFVTGMGGQVYRVGVRRIGRDLRSIVENEDLSPVALTYIAVFLHYGGNIPGPPTPSPTEDVATPHGPGVVAISEVESGSLLHMEELKQIAPGKIERKPIRRNAQVAVAVVRKGDYLIYASAQNDGVGGQPATAETLKGKVLGMLQGLTFSRELDK